MRITYLVSTTHQERCANCGLCARAECGKVGPRPCEGHGHVHDCPNYGQVPVIPSYEMEPRRAQPPRLFFPQVEYRVQRISTYRDRLVCEGGYAPYETGLVDPAPEDLAEEV